jgi:hypothetical protein
MTPTVISADKHSMRSTGLKGESGQDRGNSADNTPDSVHTADPAPGGHTAKSTARVSPPRPMTDLPPAKSIRPSCLVVAVREGRRRPRGVARLD